jgi:hypothetical protein
MSIHATRAASLAMMSILVGRAGAAPAGAEPAPGAPPALAAPPALHVDAEIDPTAYALSGNSIHVGIGYRRFRLDLGNFAIAIPAWLHGNDGFDASFDGYGAKLQVFPFDEQRGLFAGIDGGWSRVWIQRKGTDLAVRQQQLSAGVHLGYRIAVIDRFYVTPWIGVSYQPGARDVVLAEATFEAMPISVFPAVHLGYRFQ